MIGILGRIMRRWLIFLLDIIAVFLSPFAASMLRGGPVLAPAALAKLLPLALIATGFACLVFIAMGTQRVVWRYFSLPDLLRVAGTATLVVLLPLPVCFAIDRLDSVARSIPILQWFVLVSVMIAVRLAARSVRQLQSRRNGGEINPNHLLGDSIEWVLVVGLSPFAELYIQAVAQTGQSRLRIAGVLAGGTESKGRMVRSQRVIGDPGELSSILRDLEIHGIFVTKIVLAEPLDGLTATARAELVHAERERSITVQSIPELLGVARTALSPPPQEASQVSLSMNSSLEGRLEPLPSQPLYHGIKRAVDVLAALLSMVLLAPLIASIAMFVAADVGRPVIFWQQRPGRNGLPFKLYKFRTMRSAHDDEGNRVEDSERVSRYGEFLRRLRIDELPQLFNVLTGDMSFIGPRPLLWADMPADPRLRLSVRPGLTGWAQVNGGRAITPEDKAALDAWYVTHLSPSLDLKILRRTTRLLVRGERTNPKALRAAQAATLDRAANSNVPTVISVEEHSQKQSEIEYAIEHLRLRQLDKGLSVKKSRMI